MPFSHHSHSGEFCSHAQDTLEDAVQAAISQGMVVFCLTEHMPRSDSDLYKEKIEAGVTSQSLIENEANYYLKATQLREKYATKIKILIGFESEWIHKERSFTLIQDTLARYSFDLFVGSVHHLHGLPIDWGRDSYLQAREKSGRTDEKLFEDYFDAQFEMLQGLRPTVVGHFDLIRLHCHDYNLRDGAFRNYEGIWKRILRNLRFICDYGGLLELNSAAIRKGLLMPYPAAEICQEYLALNGRFCLSDDSHGVQQVGAKYSEMLDFVQEQGIKELHSLELRPRADGGSIDSRFPRTHVRPWSLEEVKKMPFWTT